MTPYVRITERYMLYSFHQRYIGKVIFGNEYAKALVKYLLEIYIFVLIFIYYDFPHCIVLCNFKKVTIFFYILFLLYHFSLCFFFLRANITFHYVKKSFVYFSYHITYYLLLHLSLSLLSFIFSSFVPILFPCLMEHDTITFIIKYVVLVSCGTIKVFMYFIKIYN